MKDIDELLSEAEIGKQSAVFNRITDEAMPFWQGIVERIETGKAIKPYVVHRILRDEFDVHIVNQQYVNESGTYRMANKKPKDVDKLIAEAESATIQALKADNLKLLKQLDKAKNKKEDMIEAVYEAVSTNLRTWNKPNIPKPKSIKKSKDEEIAVAILSDVQLAKVTPEYNTEIAEKE